MDTIPLQQMRAFPMQLYSQSLLLADRQAAQGRTCRQLQEGDCVVQCKLCMSMWRLSVQPIWQIQAASAFCKHTNQHLDTLTVSVNTAVNCGPCSWSVPICAVRFYTTKAAMTNHKRASNSRVITDSRIIQVLLKAFDWR